MNPERENRSLSSDRDDDVGGGSPIYGRRTSLQDEELIIIIVITCHTFMINRESKFLLIMTDHTATKA